MTIKEIIDGFYPLMHEASHGAPGTIGGVQIRTAQLSVGCIQQASETMARLKQAKDSDAVSFKPIAEWNRVEGWRDKSGTPAEAHRDAMMAMDPNAVAEVVRRAGLTPIRVMPGESVADAADRARRGEAIGQKIREGAVFEVHGRPQFDGENQSGTAPLWQVTCPRCHKQIQLGELEAGESKPAQCACGLYWRVEISATGSSMPHCPGCGFMWADPKCLDPGCCDVCKGAGPKRLTPGEPPI